MQWFLCFLFLLCSGMGFSEELLDKRLQEAIHVDPEGPNLVGYLCLDRERAIDQSTYLYVKFALQHFKERGVRFVLLQLNTPGGEVFSSLKICDLLQKLDTNDHIPVVAFIDNWAISAGAMLAYSCRFIGIVKSASMGAAEPVLMGGEGKMESAGEKINSALRAEISNLASFYGRNPLIAEAMVDKDLLLVLRGKTVMRLEGEEQIRKGDQILSRQGKLLTLNAEQMLQWGVADFLVPPEAVVPPTEEERVAGEWPAGKNLLFTQPFFATIPKASLISYHHWKIDFFAFLSHPLIASLLSIGLIVGIYLEMSHPGLLFPALTAVACFALLLLSNFALAAVDWLEVIILVAGIALLLLEIFVFPSFGILAILGVVLTFTGVFLLFLPWLGTVDFAFDAHQWSLMGHELMRRVGWFSGVILISVLLIFLLIRFLPQRFPLIRRFVLQGEQRTSEGFVAGLPVQALPAVGSLGTAHTPLGPGGKISVEGVLFEAFSDGEWIEKGESVKIARHLGNKIFVKREEKR